MAASAVRFYESIGLLSEPARLHGQRRYSADVLGQLAFVDVAQNAGFKLEEIKKLMRGASGGDGMAVPLRELSARKLDEVEALLERAQATKQWLKLANTCDCGSPDECTLFPAPGEKAAADVVQVVHVAGGGCRRERSA